MTKADFVEWRFDAVTQQVFSQIKERIEQLKDELAYSAGNDPTSDARKSGAILAFKEILEVDFIEESHGN